MGCDLTAVLAEGGGEVFSTAGTTGTGKKWKLKP